MLILNNTSDLSKHIIENNKPIILSYNFLKIYGLPFCSLYTKKLLRLHHNLLIALNVDLEQATATLAIIEGFPNLIINNSLQAELEIIINNSNSNTKLFVSPQKFSSYAKDLLLKNK